MTEVWFPLDFMGYDNYDVSNQGRVRKHNKTSTRLMMVRTTPAGHAYTRLTADGVQSTHSIAKLVLEAFRAPKLVDEANYILHLDGDRTNNHIDNLRWTTRGNAIRYHRSYIRESKSKYCTQRPLIEMSSRQLYKSVLEAARELAIPPIDIYNQCMNIYSPQSDFLELRFEWVDWD